jgi:uncharacterized SAM-binding protein YcdF (DUF218 family)
MHPRIVCALLIAGAVATAWIGRHTALTGVARLLVAEDPLAPVQMIVVSLASPIADTLEAARLYRDGLSSTILLPTWAPAPFHEEVRRLGILIPEPTELAMKILEQSGVPAAAIQVLPGAADGTATEVAVVAAFAKVRQPDSLLVIAARSHSARVQWFLRRELPAHTRLIVRSPVNDRFTPEAWWHSRDQSREVVIEYLRWVNMLVLRDPWGARRAAEPGSAYVGDERPETVGTEPLPFSAVAEDGARPGRFAI